MNKQLYMATVRGVSNVLGIIDKSPGMFWLAPFQDVPSRFPDNDDWDYEPLSNVTDRFPDNDDWDYEPLSNVTDLRPVRVVDMDAQVFEGDDIKRLHFFLAKSYELLQDGGLDSLFNSELQKFCGRLFPSQLSTPAEPATGGISYDPACPIVGHWHKEGECEPASLGEGEAKHDYTHAGHDTYQWFCHKCRAEHAPQSPKGVTIELTEEEAKRKSAQFSDMIRFFVSTDNQRWANILAEARNLLDSKIHQLTPPIKEPILGTIGLWKSRQHAVQRKVVNRESQHLGEWFVSGSTTQVPWQDICDDFELIWSPDALISPTKEG